MRYLYIFPHPDDESFGPAAAISKQLRQGHEVFLLTLTKGEATKQRFKYGYSKDEMGNVRYGEMKCVEKTLGLSGMTVLDFPDSGLCEIDPRILENAVKKYIKEIKPNIIISYPVYGISGFPDHLVMHAIAKRVFLELKEEKNDYLKRLAFFALSEVEENPNQPFNLKPSKKELIDCIFPVDEIDIHKFKSALNCYETYQEVIDKTGVRDSFKDHIYFEIFQEDFKPPLHDLTERV